MSESKYILIYPFKTRSEAFDVANNIYDSLMWDRGQAYPIDEIPCRIIPVEDFNKQQATIDEQKKEIEQLEVSNNEYIREISRLNGVIKEQQETIGKQRREIALAFDVIHYADSIIGCLREHYYGKAEALSERIHKYKTLKSKQ